MTQTPLSIQPADTWVLLIGMGEFKYPKLLHPIPAVYKNLEKLRQLLVNPEIMGIPDTHIFKIEDKERNVLYQQLIAIMEPLPKSFDTLMVYYVGHGIHDDDDVYLAATDSIYNKPTTGMAFEQLWDETKKASNLLYVLDCCFSGRASKVIEQQGPKNIALLTASSSTDPAKAPTDKSHTAFTECLIRLLEQGCGNEQALTPHTLFEELKIQLPKNGYPMPSYIHVMGEIRFAKNRAYNPHRPTIFRVPLPRLDVKKLQPDQLHKQLADSIDSKILTEAFLSEKFRFLSSIGQAVKYEVEKCSAMDTLALTINKEKIDPSPNRRYAKALYCYMKGNRFEGEFVDSYVSPYVIRRVKIEFTDFFSSTLIINRLSEGVRVELIKINQNIISQIPDSDRQKLTLALNSILEGDVTKFVRDIVVSNSFQESMSQVLNELRTKVITTAIVTAIVSSLMVIGFSAKIGVAAWFLIPIIAIIITYETVTFKQTFSSKVSEKISVVVDKELYDDISFKIAQVLKEVIVSRIVENFANKDTSDKKSGMVDK